MTSAINRRVVRVVKFSIDRFIMGLFRLYLKSEMASIKRGMTMTKSKMDSFFDTLDSIADKAVSTLKDVHYPGKEDDDEKAAIPDAEVVSETLAIRLGTVTGPDGRGLYHHVFRAASTQTLCSVDLPHRKLTIMPMGFIGNVCTRCLSRLIAREAQSNLKELTDGK